MAEIRKPLMDIDQPGLQVEINSYKPGDGLTWKSLFPLKYTQKFDIKGLEGTEGIPVAADRVAFNTKAPKKTRKTIGSWNGKLAKYAVSREKDEIECVEYLDAKALAEKNEDKAAARDLVDQVYDDVKFCHNAMDYKVELDTCRIASSGIHSFPASIEGDMATEDVINFNVPKENFKGVGHKWSDAENADGLKDISDAQKAIIKNGGDKPNFAYMEKDKFEELCRQKATLKHLYPQLTAEQLGMVSADLVDINRINQYMRGKGYPQIGVLDTYVTIEHKDGKRELIKPWNVNVVTLSPTQQLGWTYYKTVPKAEATAAIQAYGAFYKVTIWGEVNPMLEGTMAEAYVQPGLINRRSLVFINTDNTTWANGASAK
ncbi:MAG: major capsid protein [Fibrobacter sp.]|nr:major capsid protein [Fibrobacter sp.]